MYKVIFSDLDATLLTDDKKICDKNLKAIKEAESKGVKFVVCTGRLPFCYSMYKDELNLDEAVSTNGEVVISKGKIIKANFLPKDVVRKVIEYGIAHNEYERIFGLDFLYLLNIEKGGSDVNFYKESKGVSHKEALALVDGINIYKLGFFSDREHLIEVRKDIDNMHLNADTVFSGPRLLEVVVKGETKAKGVVDYCKYNNIDIKDTIGAGDEENDAEMLKTVGLACCPSNASDSIKQICKEVTTANNNDGAIAEIIEKYVI